jgi:hypothetical protein
MNNTLIGIEADMPPRLGRKLLVARPLIQLGLGIDLGVVAPLELYADFGWKIGIEFAGNLHGSAPLTKGVFRPSLLQGTPTLTPIVCWCVRSSYAGDYANAPQATAAKEPAYHRVECVELSVDRLAMHPHVPGAVCLPVCGAHAAEGCPVVA